MTVYRFLSQIRPIELGQLIRRCFYIGRKKCSVKGRQYYVDPLSNFGANLLAHGEYEPETTRLIESILKPGDTFLDVGANEGWLSVLASFSVGEQGKVVAVEPQERCWTPMLRNLMVNRRLNCALIPCAVGDQAGVASLSLYPSLNAEATTLVQSKRRSSFPRQEAPVITLDELIARCRVGAIKLMKIDCEGYEYRVLKGAAKSLSLKLFAHILVEYHSNQLHELGETVQEIEAYLLSFGYIKDGNSALNVFHA